MIDPSIIGYILICFISVAVHPNTSCWSQKTKLMTWLNSTRDETEVSFKVSSDGSDKFGGQDKLRCSYNAPPHRNFLVPSYMVMSPRR